jgi:hypothetical protein
MTVFEELFLNPHMGRVLSYVKGKPSFLTAPAFLPTDKLLFKGGGGMGIPERTVTREFAF